MVKLSDLFRYYKHGTPHQMAAIVELEAELLKVAPAILNRDQAWYKTWQQGGKLHNYGPAIKLIKEFEGCHLSAYPDPLSGGDPWTIGYGTTRYSDGRKVQRGDKITVIEASSLLELEIDRIAAKLRATRTGQASLMRCCCTATPAPTSRLVCYVAGRQKADCGLAISSREQPN
jgi:hypothetical protein